VAASGNIETSKIHLLQAKLQLNAILGAASSLLGIFFFIFLELTIRNSSNSNNLSLATEDKIVKSCNDLEIRYMHEVNLEILNKGMYKNGERLRKMALEFPYLD